MEKKVTTDKRQGRNKKRSEKLDEGYKPRSSQISPRPSKPKSPPPEKKGGGSGSQKEKKK